MRNLNELDKYRLCTPVVLRQFGGFGDDKTGCFIIPSRMDGKPLRCIVSAVFGWDHVSVSRKDRCPKWPEMEQIKRLFFQPGETAYQLHVPESKHINNHPYCLHIWRAHDFEIPLPPSIMVGVP